MAGGIAKRRARSRPDMVHGPSAGRLPSRASTVRFIARFSGLWLLGIGILSLFPSVSQFEVRLTSWKLGHVLTALGIDFTSHDAEFRIGASRILIVPDCTPLVPTVLLSSAILAYPARLTWRAAGIGAGILVLGAFNLLRILLVIAANLWVPRLAEGIHVHFFQTLTLVILCGLFAAWIALQSRPARS